MGLNRLSLPVVVVMMINAMLLSQGCLEEERIALLQIKTSFVEYPNISSSLFSWGKDALCCSWEGVTCSNSTTRRVVEIDLSFARYWNLNASILNASMGEYWFLNESMGDWYLNASIFLPFQELNVLDLSATNIAGCVANEGFERLSRLAKLEVLYLAGNLFNNSILSSIKELSSLKHLYLDHNMLKRSINIKEFDSLSNLEVLSLTRNYEIQDFVTLTGSEGPSRLNKLETLDLRFNNFNNSILSSLKGLSSLKHLYLDHNQLQGSMDTKEFDSLSNLEVLSLRGNEIQDFVTLTGYEGPLRLNKLESLDLGNNRINHSTLSFLKGFSSFKHLYLNGNHLEGSIDTKGICELKHLQELNIRYNNLNGSLPWCFSNLTNLRVLDISFNHFTGNISLSPLGSLTFIQDLKLSDNHFQIPISLGPFFNLSNLKNLNGDHNEIYESTELVHNLIPRFQLQSLSLACNGFGGTFPKYLYYQHDLQFVDLSHIKMTGEFPSWLLQNNTKLEELYLVNNSLSGSLELPNDSHVNLSHLDISRNHIQNKIPTGIGACFPRLVFLNLSRNDFGGSIPSSISNMSLLEVLDLSNNSLSGNIPEQLVEDSLSLRVLMLSNNYLKGQLFWKNFNLTYLTELILRGNQLTGILPNSLSNCSTLQALDVSLNNLSGKIPRWIGYMSSLEYLDLSENNLFGSLPSNFCSSRRMIEVYLSKNKLEGSLLGALDGCLGLKRLDLSHNYFRGGIPKSIGSLLELSFLLLGYNNLEAEIPRQLCELKKLSLIDLSHNNLCGHILPCLHSRSEWYKEWGSVPVPSAFTPTRLEDPSVEITTKSISYSFKGIILTYISGIDLSCNNLTGEIPFRLGNLSNMRLLNLSHNSLTGPIPPTFSNLKEIETLDLSYNNLNGEIPPQLLDLNFLSAFSVAHNNLSGKTPEMVAQFSTFNKSIYEGNPFLCGPPLTRNCTGAIPPSPVPRSQTHKKEENGVIDMEAFYVTFSVAYIMVLLAIGAVLYINPQWQQAWFYFIGESINNCYYFLVDNLPVPARFRRFQPCV